MKVFILAAGLGTRLGDLTKDKPKPMMDINGRPFLEYLIESLRRQDLTDIVLCVGYKAEVIKQHFGDGKDFGVSIHYSTGSKPLGTAGEVRNASDLIDDRFMFMYGDTFIDFDVNEMLQFHKAHHAEVTILCTRSNKEGRSGGITIEDGRIISFEEKVEKSFISAGVFICEARLKDLLLSFDQEHLSFEIDVVPHLIARKSLFGFISDNEFIDIGIKESLEKFISMKR